jgi:hypothetical protein
MPLLPLHAGVQMKQAPPPAYIPEYDIDEEGDPDVRLCQYARDHMVVRDNEFFASEADQFGELPA